ncbi:unnamed protein product [Protopolystoma xenopodis]|uniref:Uncharacterized protein n=1 Tax=Protopolystoma xenopodis TaxID=117903 RepID=A0A3S5AQT5_9PLAT|nr:unnamed protein product [Protopolystoma xenopodis]
MRFESHQGEVGGRVALSQILFSSRRAVEQQNHKTTFTHIYTRLWPRLTLAGRLAVKWTDPVPLEDLREWVNCSAKTQTYRLAAELLIVVLTASFNTTTTTKRNAQRDTLTPCKRIVRMDVGMAGMQADEADQESVRLCTLLLTQQATPVRLVAAAKVVILRQKWAILLRINRDCVHAKSALQQEVAKEIAHPSSSVSGVVMGES